MENYILHSLISSNPEFRSMYSRFESKGLIQTFDMFSDIFDNEYCFPENLYSMSMLQGPTLKKIYDSNYNLLTPYVTMIYTLKALMGYTINGDMIDGTTKVVIGKNHMTKNFPNVYDSICPWIETKNHILDPVLGIVVHKSIKDELGYVDIKSDIKWSIDIDKRTAPFNLFGIVYCGDKKLALYRRYTPPKTMVEMLSKNIVSTNESTLIREYIRDNNKPLYNKFNMLISMGKIIDLTKDMSVYDNCHFASTYNPDLTLGRLLRLGQNYGKCGIYAKAFSNLFYADKFHTMHIGKCEAIVGSKNSYDGCHAWIELDDAIVDTSLMAIIPIEFKETFGYTTEHIQYLGRLESKTDYFGDKIDIADELMYGDILYHNRMSGAYFYHYDFVEELPHIINNTGMDMMSKCTLAENNSTIED